MCFPLRHNTLKYYRIYIAYHAWVSLTSLFSLLFVWSNRHYMCHGCQLWMGEEISKVLKIDNLTHNVKPLTDSEKEFRDGLWPNERWGFNLSKALTQIIASSCRTRYVVCVWGREGVCEKRRPSVGVFNTVFFLIKSSDEKKLGPLRTSICVLLIILVSIRNKRKIACENTELQKEK